MIANYILLDVYCIIIISLPDHSLEDYSKLWNIEFNVLTATIQNFVFTYCWSIKRVILGKYTRLYKV